MFLSLSKTLLESTEFLLPLKTCSWTQKLETGNDEVTIWHNTLKAVWNKQVIGFPYVDSPACSQIKRDILIWSSFSSFDFSWKLSHTEEHIMLLWDTFVQLYKKLTRMIAVTHETIGDVSSKFQSLVECGEIE